MNKKCSHCNTNISIGRWSDHMAHYHGGTSVRPFGLTIAQIEANVNAYIERHAVEWTSTTPPAICEYCRATCYNPTACRRRRLATRQQKHRNTLEGK